MNRFGSFRLNLFASWGSHAVSILIGVFLMPYVLHTLGDAQYGTWIFISSIAGYSGLLYLGFGETISRYVATYHATSDWKKLNQVASCILLVYLGMATLALCIAGVLAWLAPVLFAWGDVSLLEIRLVILVLGLNVFVGLIGSVYGGVLMGIHRFDIERGIQIVTTILRLILIVTFLREEWGLLTIASIFLSLTIIENLCQMAFAYRQVKTLSLRLSNFNLKFLKDSSRFSAYAFLSAISNQLIDCTDSIVIGIFLSPKAIVPFYIALRLTRMISTPIEYIGRIAMPKAGDLFARGEQSKLEQLITKGVGMAFLLSTAFFIGAGFFGKTVITTWVGPGYEQSHLLFMVLLVTRMVAIPSGVMRCVLFGMGRVKAPSIIYFCEAVANVLLSILLIGPFGLLGVALGTAVPLMLIESAILLPFAFRITQVSFRQVIRQAIGPQLPALMALLAYSVVFTEIVPQTNGWFYICAVSAGGGAVLVMTWLASNRMIKHFEFKKRSECELSTQPF